jgi:hypothetical protein
MKVATDSTKSSASSVSEKTVWVAGSTTNIGVPVVDIVRDIVDRGRTKRLKGTTAKAFLSSIRNLLVYVGVQGFDVSPELLSSLLAVSKDLPDQDSERKIVRLLYAIFLRYVNDTLPDSLLATVKADVNLLLREEIKCNSGSRQCLAYRTLGVMCKYTDNTREISTSVTSALKALQYPSRTKASSMFGGQKKADKEFETAISLWSALLSCLCRAEVMPSRELKPSLLKGSASDNATIARHAITLLGKLSSSADVTQEELLEICGHFSGLIKALVENLEHTEAVSCSVLIQSVATLLSNPNVPLERASALCSSITQLMKHHRYFKFSRTIIPFK